MGKITGYFWLMLLAVFPAGSFAGEDRFERLRERMVTNQIEARGITSPDVIGAMKRVPRHFFVPEALRDRAYGDHPLPIGEGQTISQPYIVAFMTEIVSPKPSDRILEIGTGSGYQAAVLAELAAEVYTIELIESLGRRAAGTLESLGYRNVHVKIGDGYGGWPEKAPFDAVLVTCAPEDIPHALVEQLKEGGRMVIPVGGRNSIQKMVYGEKLGGRLVTRNVLDVRFVPMVKGGE